MTHDTTGGLGATGRLAGGPSMSADRTAGVRVAVVDARLPDGEEHPAPAGAG
ncbi:hypothetical protein PYK79_17340 [Streptomyces sp. ID05-04B]|uniref:hypothetical protein n=1 Tax=unclassified Streptomyces TaxID=2593676 RepID=UPI00131F156B|nr:MULTISPECIES: hypothetical protein [unclassified Streptomyces]MDX5564776.1 hypothetical protein [Streptomyces sp. ID05-04B]